MQGLKRKNNTVDGGQSLLDGDGLKLPKKAATIRAITSTTDGIISSGSAFSTQVEGFLDHLHVVTVKKPCIPSSALSLMGVTIQHELPPLNTKPVYRVSERSGIVKSDSCLHFGELSCEFDAVVGEGTHGNLMSGCLAGKGDSQFVRKLFLLEEDDTGEEKKSQLHAVIKEWFFYQKLHSKAYLFLNKPDYGDVMDHLKNIDLVEQQLLESIILVPDSINLDSKPRLVMRYLGEPFEKVAKKHLSSNEKSCDKGISIFEENLHSAFQLLNNILDALNDMHQLGIIHGDAKPVNFVWDDALCAHPVDFGYSYYLSDDQSCNVITSPALFMLETRGYLSRRSAVKLSHSGGLGPFVDIYALTRYLSLYDQTISAFHVLPSKTFFNLSSFRLIEKMDEQAYQAQYDASNFWVRAVSHFNTQLFKVLLKFELDVIKDSWPICLPNEGAYPVMLVWLVCITLNRVTQQEVLLTDDGSSLKISLCHSEKNHETLMSKGIDGINLDNVYALSKHSPRLFFNPQLTDLFDASISQAKCQSRP